MREIREVAGLVHADEALFAALYERHYRSIRAFCRRRLPPDLVDDAVAETFLTAWRRLDDVPEGDGALVWLYGVASGTVVARFPARAQALLHTPIDARPAPLEPTPGAKYDCFTLSPREVDAARDLIGVALIPATTSTPAIGIEVLSVLPHGDMLLWGG